MACDLEQQIQKVRKCSSCTDFECELRKLIEDGVREPIQLNHKNPEEVKVLVITEQPKIPKGGKVTNDTFWEDVQGTSTAVRLRKLLGDEFKQSIEKGIGPFYWTHHTKCSSTDRKVQKECANTYLVDELSCFENLKLVISFGSTVYEYFKKNTDLEIDFRREANTITDYFYEFLKANILQEHHCKSEQFELATIELKDKKVNYLPLPHPSGASTLAKLLEKTKPMIMEYVNSALENK